MLQLRPHQNEVVEQLSQGFLDGHRCQLLYAPTGFGKTEVAMSIMRTLSQEYQKTAMVLDRIVLVEQTSLRMGKYGIQHGVMQAQHWRYRPMERIQVCSAQTLEKRKIIPDINVMIIDECHIQRKGTVKLIQENPHIKVIGLTATPFTKGLGNIYTNIVGASATSDLVDKGWLTALKVYIAKEIDMTGAKKVAGEWSADEVSTRGMQITGDIVSEWVKKTHELFSKPVKTIVFCSGVEHGRDLVKEFAAAGYNFISISYKEDDEFKRATIEDFSRPDTTINGLIATDILTRGFDVPDVQIAVSARPFSKSFSSHVQQLGRVMRPYDGKQFGVWLDHSGNYLRFQKDWDKLYTDGVTELREGGEVAKKELTDKEKKQSKCPACSALWTSPTRTCSSCGFERPNMKEIVKVPGELRELHAANRKLQINNQDFYSQLLYYAQVKGYKPGWAAFKYQEKFGAFPDGLTSIVQKPAAATLGWIKHRTIAYARSRQA
jgi:superfamily II DNA or RNA helicase